MTFKNDAHRHIFKAYVACSPYRFTNSFLAVLFLLSAEKDLWFRSKLAINKKEIDFDKIPQNELSTYGYILLQLAKDIYLGTQHVTLQDIGDPYLVSDRTCMLILEAIRICRQGYPYIGINKRFD